jgi:hypothetical protein
VLQVEEAQRHDHVGCVHVQHRRVCIGHITHLHRRGSGGG